MRDALKSTGREILFSLCEWGYMFPWLWSHEIGHSYRMSGDIYQHYTVDRSGCRGKTAYSLTTGDVRANSPYFSYFKQTPLLTVIDAVGRLLCPHYNPQDA